jgi:hypothetical protein
MKRLRMFLTIGLLVVCLATMGLPLDRAAGARAQKTCGGIEGRVTTPEGWLIPRAKIFFLSKESKKSSNVESNEDGKYEACLSPGTYDLSVDAPGFKSAKRKGIKVNYGERNVIDFPLKRGRPVTSH